MLPASIQHVTIYDQNHKNEKIHQIVVSILNAKKDLSLFDFCNGRRNHDI